MSYTILFKTTGEDIELAIGLYDPYDEADEQMSKFAERVEAMASENNLRLKRWEDDTIISFESDDEHELLSFQIVSVEDRVQEKGMFEIIESLMKGK